MSTPLSPRPPCPPLRNAACLIVSIGCLLTAGSVLSSVAKPPPRPAVGDSSRAPKPSYALPCPFNGFEPGVRPLQAVVCVEGGTLHITNASVDIWRDIRLDLGGNQHWRFAKLGSYETCLVSLPRRDRPPCCQIFHAPVPLTCRCRTPHGMGAWAGYVAP